MEEKIKLELTHKEMRILFCFGVPAMTNHMKEHKTVPDSEFHPLQDKLWNAWLTTEEARRNDK